MTVSSRSPLGVYHRSSFGVRGSSLELHVAAALQGDCAGFTVSLQIEIYLTRGNGDRVEDGLPGETILLECVEDPTLSAVVDHPGGTVVQSVLIAEPHAPNQPVSRTLTYRATYRGLMAEKVLILTSPTCHSFTMGHPGPYDISERDFVASVGDFQTQVFMYSDEFADCDLCNWIITCRVGGDLRPHHYVIREGSWGFIRLSLPAYRSRSNNTAYGFPFRYWEPSGGDDGKPVELLAVATADSVFVEDLNEALSSIQYTGVPYAMCRRSLADLWRALVRGSRTYVTAIPGWFVYALGRPIPAETVSIMQSLLDDSLALKVAYQENNWTPEVEAQAEAFKVSCMEGAETCRTIALGLMQPYLNLLATVPSRPSNQHGPVIHSFNLHEPW